MVRRLGVRAHGLSGHGNRGPAQVVTSVAEPRELVVEPSRAGHPRGAGHVSRRVALARRDPQGRRSPAGRGHRLLCHLHYLRQDALAVGEPQALDAGRAVFADKEAAEGRIGDGEVASRTPLCPAAREPLR